MGALAWRQPLALGARSAAESLAVCPRPCGNLARRVNPRLTPREDFRAPDPHFATGQPKKSGRPRRNVSPPLWLLPPRLLRLQRPHIGRGLIQASPRRKEKYRVPAFC